MRTIFVLILLAAGMPAVAEGIFEPECSAYDSKDGRRAIHAQQAEYTQAKTEWKETRSADAWQKAYDAALFNMQRAWLEVNRADYILRQESITKADAQAAKTLLDSAVSHCEAESVCDPDGSHAEEQAKAKKAATWMLEFNESVKKALK